MAAPWPLRRIAMRALKEARVALPAAGAATRASTDAFIAGMETKQQ